MATDGTTPADGAEVDWAAIQREYEAGQLSLRAIAKAHGLRSHSPIIKRAQENGWSRAKLSSRVKTRVQEKLIETDATEARPTTATNARGLDEDETIEAAAERGLQVVKSHRQDIARARDLVARMLGELDATTTGRDQIEAMIEAVCVKTDKDGQAQVDQKRLEAMMRAVSLPGRATVIRDLSQAMQRLVTLERQAFNLDSKDGDSSGPADAVPLPERLRYYQQREAIERGEAGDNVVSLAERIRSQS